MSGPAYFTGGMNIAKNWDWIQAFILCSVDPAGVTTPIDVTGSVFRMMIRHRDTDHHALLMVTSEDGTIDVTDPVGGAFTIIISRERLKILFPGEFVADLVRLRPDGAQERLWDANPVIVVEGVTRP